MSSHAYSLIEPCCAPCVVWEPMNIAVAHSEVQKPSACECQEPAACQTAQAPKLSKVEDSLNRIGILNRIEGKLLG